MLIQAKDIKLELVSKLKPNPKNRNKHPEEQIERLCEIIRYQGFRQPVVVSNRTGLVVAGHGRLLAAKKLKIKEVPVVYQDFEDEEQEYAFGVSDNAIASWAELDLSGINTDMAELGPDFDIDMLGLKDFVLEPAEKLEPGCDDDEVPEAKDTRAKLGDIWQLGRHRLMCGDATDAHNYERLMIGEKPLLMVTDPPYGVSYDATWREGALGDKLLGKARTGKVANYDRADWYDVWALSNADIAYVWHASAFSDVVMDSLRRAAFEVRQQIIWNKSVLIMGRGAYHWKHEPCWYAVRKGCDANWKGDRKQTTVWDAPPPTHIMSGSKEERTSHPTQKPALVYEIPIENHTIPGDLLYEPFSGSGTAFIAAEKTGRRVYGFELDSKYCDVILARWEKYTGKEAVRLTEGQYSEEGETQAPEHKIVKSKAKRKKRKHG